MAIMIPSTYSVHIKSNAERHVFDWFKQAPGTDNWVVLHSLGISSHIRVIHGEIDFLVLAPDLGVFALEVKGGRVRRNLGKWEFTNRYGETDAKIRGPFNQAWEGIYSIKNSIETKVDIKHEYLKNVVFGIGVMFPDIKFSTVGVEEEEWQVFDIEDGKNVKKFVERLSFGAIKARKRLGLHAGDYVLPSEQDVYYLTDILRGDFDRDVPLRIKQKYAEESFLTLTNEQALCIEQLSDNRRILIRGTAGTGKTLLAIEATRRYVKSGERVAFFCYNRLLGEWVQAAFSGLPNDQRPVYIGTFHSYMLDLLISHGVDIHAAQDGISESGFFTNTLPDIILTNREKFSDLYDRIIIDEAQDLLSEKYLEVIDLLLRKGLAHGCWFMFGDFSMQAIYSDILSEMQYLEILQRRAAFVIFKLSKNCRNTRKICIDIENIVGIPENAAQEDNIDSPAVDHIVYRDEDDQLGKLQILIHDLLNRNIQQSDIVILSPKRRSGSVVRRLKGIVVEDFSVESRGQIRFSTIQSFKGLESSSIILVDIESYQDEKLIYVGLSRARFDLHVLESQHAYEERMDLILKRRYGDG